MSVHILPIIPMEKSSSNVPKSSKDAMDVMVRILGNTSEARHAIDAAYALGVVDGIIGPKEAA